jgi:AcrR family transcriptional regulator
LLREYEEFLTFARQECEGSLGFVKCDRDGAVKARAPRKKTARPPATPRDREPPAAPDEEAPPSSEEPASLRRVPLQARSKERFERILDAAEQEFARVGYDAATTESIAERAGTSIGSLYQFFPNKRALFDALAERFLADVLVFFDRFVAHAAEIDSWEALVDASVDGFWAMQTGSRAFKAIWIHGNLSLELIQASEALNAKIAERASGLFARFAPGLTPADRDLVAAVAVETVSAMLFVATRRGEPFAARLREETKLLLRRYLGPYVSGAGAGNSSMT